MRKLAFASLGIALVALVNAAPASAQLDHTYVTQTGSGSVCSFAAPCGSVTTAIGQTNDGGDLYILNGDYTENITITKGISINGDEPSGVIIRTTTNNGTSTAITVNAPGKTVGLHNLSIYGDAFGVQLTAARGLIIASGTSINSNGIGLMIANSAAGASLNMNNVSVGGNSGGNILIQPSGSVGVEAFLNNVRIRGGAFGLKADATATSGTIRVVFQDGWANNASGSGFNALATGTGFANVLVRNSVANNNGDGARANGANARMLVTNSALTHNNNGLNQLAGSEVDTFGDNEIRMNTNNTLGTITSLAKQ